MFQVYTFQAYTFQANTLQAYYVRKKIFDGQTEISDYQIDSFEYVFYISEFIRK